ncbi:MAG: mannose-1-phosphate guanylyltransferase, partial [Chlamydiales bacterium]
MKAFILAGGSGTRLWPISRSSYPKQFLKIVDNESFLQKTLRRFLGFLPEEEIFIITHADFYHEVLSQIKEIEPKLERNIILEPERKNTAPAIAYAISQIKSLDDNEAIIVAPSDHLVAPEEHFYSVLSAAEKKAKSGKLVTFGVRPTRPETGYGYILAHEEQVEKFIEKPNLENAKSYLKNGNYYWNAGMFLFTAATFRAELQEYAPEIASLCKKGSYKGVPSLSLDYALMEKSKKVVMLPLNLTWSDVGSWEDIYDLLEKDENNNACQGNVLSIATTNSLLMAEKRLVSTIGLENIVVIDTEDVVLVADKSRVQEVKQIVN